MSKHTDDDIDHSAANRSRMARAAALSEDELALIAAAAREVYGRQGEGTYSDTRGRVWLFRVSHDPAGLELSLARPALSTSLGQQRLGADLDDGTLGAVRWLDAEAG